MTKTIDELMQDFAETNQYQTPGGGEFTDIAAEETDQDVIDDEA